ncbi:hypothetical protein OLX02_12830 [Novosphingobium sp. KCTC 2891]|uniref:hypothetical protein n=1 Tax=Novosphingobium sp. KCTC 2891 TaxID=2989730 RepID=UPI00222235A3|nr:hypothetical protein [Novosphingobium sp. KCTC 2891]MCW1383707.1 hypothetical protein [Novosphingobium sp. KCTC 2891]
MLRFSGGWFTTAFCASYMALFAHGGPVLQYYPLSGRWSFGPPAGGSGPAMQWYGLMLEAGLIAMAVSALLRDRPLPRYLADRPWAVPLTAMAACFYLLRGFFT